MKSKIIFALIGGVLLAITGLFIGMNIGGNYFANFVFMGGRGYEATGYLGAIIGAIVGIYLGILVESIFQNSPE